MSKIAILRQALRDLLAEHQRDGMIPTSARFLFYELVAKGIIAKQASGTLRPGAKSQRRPDQDMIDALTDLRERGEIPWDAIVDETRALDSYTGWKSIADGLDTLNVIRLDRWEGMAPLILTESRSLAGVLRDLVRGYGAMIASTNGQSAGFLHNDVQGALRDGGRVLYLGDYDFSGGHIEDNSRTILQNYHALVWEQLALTREQVASHGLAVISKYDARDKRHHDAVETEALSQATIVQIVRDRLDALLPEPLAAIEAREATERAACRARLQRTRR